MPLILQAVHLRGLDKQADGVSFGSAEMIRYASPKPPASCNADYSGVALAIQKQFIASEARKPKANSRDIATEGGAVYDWLSGREHTTVPPAAADACSKGTHQVPGQTRGYRPVRHFAPSCFHMQVVFESNKIQRIAAVPGAADARTLYRHTLPATRWRYALYL